MLTKITAVPSSGMNKIAIQLYFDLLSKPIEQYIFSLERAETMDGPWYSIPLAMNSVFMFDETVSDILSPGNAIFYKVKMRDSDGSILEERKCQFKIKDGDRYSLAIEHNYHRYLNAQELNPFELRKRSKLSGYCSCFDDVRMESSDLGCQLCGGTGNIDGYYTPIDIDLLILNSIENQALIKEMFGEVTIDSSAVRCWTTGTINVSTEDVIINKFTNEAYEVSQVSYSKRLNYIVRQSITMTKMQQGHPIYSTLGEI